MKYMGQVNGKSYPILQREPEPKEDAAYSKNRSARPKKRYEKKNGKRCVVCGKALVGLQRAYCSFACVSEMERRKRASYKRRRMEVGEKWK